MNVFIILSKILMLTNFALSIYIEYSVLKKFLGFKAKGKYIAVGVLMIIGTICIPALIVSFLNIESVYQWIPSTILIFITAQFFCNGTWLKKFTASILYVCLNEIVQYITIPLISICDQIFISNHYYNAYHIREIALELCLIASQLLYILILKYLFEHYKIGDGFRDIKYMLFFAMENVFIVALLCEYFKIYYRNNISSSLYGNLRMIIIAVMALVCAVVTVMALHKLLKEKESRQREALMEQQFNLQSEHYKALELQSENIRKFRHDINNHLICIKNLIAGGSIPEAEEYLKKITESLESLNMKVSTGNHFADAVINEKYNSCVSKNIKFNCNVKIPPDSKIESFDLCIILGNALDNAIEACDKIHEDSNKKYIYITSMINKSFIVFEIKNSTAISQTDANIGKQNKAEHGLGLLNIQSIADKYFGAVSTEKNDNEFTLSIMLQLQ